MEENKKRELAKLLEESLQSIVIKNDHLGKISPERYRGYFLSNKRIQGVDYLKKCSNISVRNDSVKTKLLDFVRIELSEYIHDDEIMSCLFEKHGSNALVSLDHLLESLWRISLVWGIEKSILIFERTIEKNQVPYQKNIVLCGLKVKQETQIFDGIKLLPLSDSIENLPNYLPERFSASYFSSKTLLVIEFILSPAFFRPNYKIVDYKFHMETKNKEMKDVNPGNLCEILSLFYKMPVQPDVLWGHFGDDELFVHEINSSGPVSWISRDQFPRNPPISDAQGEKVKDLCKLFFSLSPKDQKRIKTPIIRWIKSKENKLNVDKMIDLGIAFESLYIGPDNTGQLSFTLSIRAAWYLGKDKENRKELMQVFKKIYKYRSQAVHTGELDATFRKGNDSIPMDKFIEESQDLCLKSIMKVIKDGKFPDWDSLVVGE